MSEDLLSNEIVLNASMPNDPTSNDSTLNDPMPRPPSEPEPEECCGEGCVRCVYDIYDEALERYRAALAAWRARHPDDPAGRGYGPPSLPSKDAP